MAEQIHVVTMPKLGESVTEGTLAQWLKNAGDPVAFDEPLFEVSTDKVDSEVPSPYDGVLLEVLVADGDTVPVGTELARIGPVGASAPGDTTTGDTTTGDSATGDTTTGDATPAAATPLGGATVPDATAAVRVRARAVARQPAGVLLSPLVRRLAAEHNLDLSAVSGSGAGGRIRREDVLAVISAQTPAGPVSAPTAPDVFAPEVVGPEGVVAPAGTEAPARVGAPAAADREEVVALSRIRLVTAERMLQSRQISPHVWTSVEVDLERIEQLRQRYKSQFRTQEGVSLTYLPFIARATVDALRAFPAVNSSLDLASKTMTLHRYVNLGIAVDLDEEGLMAPVVKGADVLNLRGIARAIKTVADGVKARRLSVDDLSGSTFTITNPGPLGSYASAAIINQPNVAIMSTEGVARRVTVVGDAIAIHHMCILGLSYDHRAFDGVTAARFLKYIRDALQDRDWESEIG